MKNCVASLGNTLAGFFFFLSKNKDSFSIWPRNPTPKTSQEKWKRMCIQKPACELL